MRDCTFATTSGLSSLYVTPNQTASLDKTLNLALPLLMSLLTIKGMKNSALMLVFACVSKNSLKPSVECLKKSGVKPKKFIDTKVSRSSGYPELILHSHAMRARQTAEIMAVKLELSQGYTVEDSELYECNDSDLISIIRNLPDDVDSVLIVGHNPAIENLADSLGPSGFGHFRPSEAAIYTFDTDEWRAIALRNCSENKFLAKPE